MKAMITGALKYKLALLVAIFFSINALASTITAAFIHTDWSSLTHTERFVIICAIIGGFSNTMLAFLNKTLSRVEHNQFPLDLDPSDGVQIETKTQTKIT